MLHDCLSWLPFNLSSATVAIFMYAEAKRSVFVCWKSFKKRDTFTELYSSTVSIVYFLILHFYAIKRFIPYNIYVRVKRTTFLKYFVSQFIVSYMPIDTYLRTNLNERILTWQYSQSGKKSIACLFSAPLYPFKQSLTGIYPSNLDVR